MIAFSSSFIYQKTNKTIRLKVIRDKKAIIHCKIIASLKVVPRGIEPLSKV